MGLFTFSWIMNNIFSIYFLYLILGFPGLYIAIRMSQDFIDTTDREYLSYTYVLWLPLLVVVTCENIWLGIKSIFHKFKALINVADQMLYMAIHKTATIAEDHKREKLKDTQVLKYFECVEQSMKQITDF